LDAQQGFWTPLEINGDGQADLVFLDREADIYSDLGSTRFHTALSRGDGSYQIQTTPWLPAGGSGLALPYYFYGSEEPDQQDELPNAVMYAHDPDGDGRDQLVILGGKGSTNANGRWDIPFHADGTLDTSGPFYDFDSSSSYPYGMCNTLKWSDQYSEYGEFPGDHDGDGRLEWICWRVLVETWQGYADSLEVFTTTPIAVDPSAPDPFAAALARPLPNLITSIANGADDATLDPHETAISYRPLTDSTIYDRGPSLGYPLRAIQDGRRVVSWYSVSDGVGGLRTFDYFYTGLRIHLGLHESFGFSDIELWDAAAGIAKQTSYNQVFPIQRTSLRTESYQLGSDLLIESTDHYWMGDELVFSGGSVFAARELQTLTRSYGIDTTPEPPHRSAVETFDYDAYGNVRQEGHYWAEGDLTPFPVPDSTLQALHQEVTTTIYDPPDFVNWFVDQIDRRSVTAQLTGAGGASLTRTTAFDYDANGRLATQILEPDGAPPDELWVRQQTDWTYDAFGNVATRTVGGGVVGQVDRTQTTIWDSRGQFPVTLENAMHHQTQVEYEPRHGKRLWAEDPNGVRTDWQYDALGRETREIRADGTETVSYYSRCDASCWPEAGASPYVKTSIASDGALAIRYNDLLGRAILDETNSFLGSPVLVMTAFDSLGRIVGHSRPNWVGWMPYFAVTTHDLLGRALTQTTPDGHVTSYAYLGLEAEVTDPRGYTRVTESNARGWIVRSTDPKQESMLYEHDPFGNVTSAWRAGDQSATEVITSYDLYGRRKTLADPNAGSWAGAPPWQWMYNFFGEVITSTDPKGQLAFFFYDGLGRRTDRLEPDGQTTTWTYDTSPSGIGKLASIDGPYQYERSLSYDALGRLMHTSHLIDQTYFASNVTYDSDGRVDKLIYPSGFGVEHEYNAQGDLLKLTESLSGDPIWTKISAEVDGQTRTVSLGNGVSSNRFHDVVTGRLVSLWDRVRPPGEPSTLLQYREVTFDPMGNLTERFDVRLWVVETMDYDELNRLTEVRSSIWDSPPSSTGSFTYDALGNLKSKTGVGTYTYAEGAGPHAVTQLDPGPGAVTRHYGYDWNGNMTCRGSLNPAICNGTVIDYTWFDKPSLIVTPSGAQSAFTYDADHARIRQVATANGNTTTTRYVGKTYESVVKDGVTEKVHHIFADGVAVAQYIDHEGGAPDAWRYLHRDHLGSTIATSDENGALVQRIDFEPHGQRIARDASYQTESPELPRGFTGHEHLEDVGLIHMNGRVYDPELGRMLSVDPFVVAPLNLQTYNRYSYVHNNPLSLTDPSGYYTSPAQAESVASSKPKTSITSKGQPKGNESGVSDKRDAEANKALSNGKTLVYTLANGSKVEVSGTGTVQHNGKTGEVTISGNLSVAGLANSEAGVALQLTPGSTAAQPGSGFRGRIMFTGPSSQSDSSEQNGREPGQVYVTGHRMGGIGPYHTALEYDDGTGQPTTLSAGSTDGELRSDVNRPTDAPVNNNTLGTVTPPAGVSPGRYFSNLLAADANYCDCFDYDVFPGALPGAGYNSNSYVPGLVRATGGVSSVNLGNYYGGETPLPAEAFGRTQQ
jgi:RHS repeat-associated protein